MDTVLMTADDIKLLERMLSCLGHSEHIGVTLGGYRTPADELRHQADCIEARDADIAAYIALVQRARETLAAKRAATK